MDIDQYSHASWALRDGSFRGSPRAIAQTRDGYLWLGTELGMLRFDGVRLVPWHPQRGEVVPPASVETLLATRDGGLWIGTRAGLTRSADGVSQGQVGLAGQYVTALIEDRRGTVWVGTSAGLAGAARLCTIRPDGTRCRGEDGAFGRFILSLFEDSAGQIWAGAETGLWRMTPVERRFALPEKSAEIHAITEAEPGRLIFALSRRLAQIAGDAVSPYPLPSDDEAFKPTALLRDRRGGLWIGTQDQGVLRIQSGRMTRYRRTDGLTADLVSDLFEDREGNVWVATPNGFDRFRAFSVVMMSTTQGLSTDSVTSVLAARDGSVWLGTANGLNRWQEGQAAVQPVPRLARGEAVGSLFQDSGGRIWVSSPRGLTRLEDDKTVVVRGFPAGYVHAIAEDSDGRLWVSHQQRGLVRLQGARVAEIVPWERLATPAARVLVADPAGGLWLGFFEGGIARFRDGILTERYTAAEGLGAGTVTALSVGGDGTLWVSTQGGLSRLQHGRVTTVTSANGLPCSGAHWAVEGGDLSLWAHTTCGLVRIARDQLDRWSASSRLKVTVYDESDGVLSYLDVGAYGPKVTTAADGRIWFVLPGGAGVIEPGHIPVNTIPPPVRVEQISADGRLYEPSSGLELPALVHDVRIDYTAMSLTAPAKVRFRYKLEGRDADWVEAGSRRQAFYSDLAPRGYRFRVTASNNDGVWNEQGAGVEFSVVPAFHETNSFAVVVVLLVTAMSWAAYRVWVGRVRADLNARFEERLAERARIARELHDTLLQGFVSAGMHLSLATESMGDPAMRAKFEHIHSRISQVVEEGRRAVEGLRMHDSPEDLDRSLARDATSLRGARAIDVRIVVEGHRQPLDPLIRDELYRMGREAITNAFRHAQPTRIEIEIEYGLDRFRLQVRDDGTGIEARTIEQGKPGHWGIRGMRERAERIGATLQLWSGPRRGTEVEVSVPARIAFRRAEPHARTTWLRRLGFFRPPSS